MTSDETPTLRIRDRRGLVAAVPALLGFHPAESLVLLCLTGPGRQVGPVMRVDLADRTPDMSEYLTRVVRRHADAVAVVVFATRPHARHRLLRRTLQAFRRDGVAVLDACVVGGGWIRSVPDTPGAGVPDIPVLPEDADERTDLDAFTALNGRAVLADRAALRSSIAGPRGSALAVAAAAVDYAAEGLLQLLESGPIDTEVWQSSVVADFDRIRERVADGRPPELAEAAALALSVTDGEVRDELLRRVLRNSDQWDVATLIAVVVRLPDAAAAALCGVLAVLAYRRGDGALAQIAVDRALAGEPGQRLAELMVQAMASALHPDTMMELTQTGAEASRPQVSRGAGG
jgi:hypothetical protein